MCCNRGRSAVPARDWTKMNNIHDSPAPFHSDVTLGLSNQGLFFASEDAEREQIYHSLYFCNLFLPGTNHGHPDVEKREILVGGQNIIPFSLTNLTLLYYDLRLKLLRTELL